MIKLRKGREKQSEAFDHNVINIVDWAKVKAKFSERQSIKLLEKFQKALSSKALAAKLGDYYPLKSRVRAVSALGIPCARMVNNSSSKLGQSKMTISREVRSGIRVRWALIYCIVSGVMLGLDEGGCTW